MPILSLAPSSQLQLASFRDFDAFRPVELLGDARSIPLDFSNFSLARALVELPGCTLLVQRTFARIFEASYRIAGTLVIVSLDDDTRATVDGVALAPNAFVALRGDTDVRFVEHASNLHATIIFSPDLPDRDWFNDRDRIQAFLADKAALATLRNLIFRILQIASAAPELLEMTDCVLPLREELLVAIDRLFSPSQPYLLAASHRHAQIIRRIDDYITSDPASAVYSDAIATECGVSVRTLGNAVRNMRGLSLHRYLRLKKLWAVRALLMSGRDGATVSSYAMSNGFYHMGEFSSVYRSTFGESPSSTLARARRGAARRSA
jgi:AraC family ethanolamine operon transcriptional activator